MQYFDAVWELSRGGVKIQKIMMLAATRSRRRTRGGIASRGESGFVPPLPSLHAAGWDVQRGQETVHHYRPQLPTNFGSS